MGDIFESERSLGRSSWLPTAVLAIGAASSGANDDRGSGDAQTPGEERVDALGKTLGLSR
jgi:hypothetical protein